MHKLSQLEPLRRLSKLGSKYPIQVMSRYSNYPKAQYSPKALCSMVFGPKSLKIALEYESLEPRGYSWLRESPTS